SGQSSRQRRAAESLLQRLDQILLVFRADVEAAVLLGQAFRVGDALLAGPGEILHAKADDVHGQLRRVRVQHLAEVARRAAAGLLAVGQYNDQARLLLV